MAATLRAAILSGDWSAGDRLPPERELASDLGISRLTLRAALSKLETEGLVRPRQGSGVRVQDWRTRAGVALLPHLLEQGDLSLLRPILELRRAVAAEALAAACGRATDEDIARLDALATELSETADPAVLAEGNLAFARAVLRIADNLPLELLFNTVARVYRARPDLSAAMLDDDGAVRASFSLTVALLRQGDPDAARTTVRRALEAIDAHTLATLGVS